MRRCQRDREDERARGVIPEGPFKGRSRSAISRQYHLPLCDAWAFLQTDSYRLLDFTVVVGTSTLAPELCAQAGNKIHLLVGSVMEQQQLVQRRPYIILVSNGLDPQS